MSIELHLGECLRRAKRLSRTRSEEGRGSPSPRRARCEPPARKQGREPAYLVVDTNDGLARCRAVVALHSAPLVPRLGRSSCPHRQVPPRQRRCERGRPGRARRGNTIEPCPRTRGRTCERIRGPGERAGRPRRALGKRHRTRARAGRGPAGSSLATSPGVNARFQDERAAGARPRQSKSSSAAIFLAPRAGGARDSSNGRRGLPWAARSKEACGPSDAPWSE